MHTTELIATFLSCFSIVTFGFSKQSTLKNNPLRFMNLLLTIIISFFISKLSTNTCFLFVMIIIQIISYFSCINIIKTFPQKIYIIFIFLISICTIISITCSYGYYYANEGLIETTDLLIPTAKNIPDDIFDIDFTLSMYLFVKSLKYYFTFTDELVPLTQFFLGFIINCIIFGNLSSIVGIFFKYKE